MFVKLLQVLRELAVVDAILSCCSRAGVFPILSESGRLQNFPSKECREIRDCSSKGRSLFIVALSTSSRAWSQPRGLDLTLLVVLVAGRPSFFVVDNRSSAILRLLREYM